MRSPDADAEIDRVGRQTDLLAQGNLSDFPLSVIRARFLAKEWGRGLLLEYVSWK